MTSAPTAPVNNDAAFNALLAAHNYTPPSQTKSQGGWYERLNPTPTPAAQPTTPIVSNPMTDIQKAGDEVQSAIKGEGVYAGKGAIERGTFAASTAAMAVPTAIADVIPGGKSILNILGQLYGNAVNAGGKITSDIGNKISDIPAVQKWAQENPELVAKILAGGETAANVGVNVGNVANVALMGEGASVGIKGGIGAVKDVRQGMDTINAVADTLPKNSPALVPLNAVKVNDLYNRAIRPTVAGKSNEGQVEKANNQAISGLQAISQNRENLTFTDANGEVVKGQTPKSVDQLSQSIAQTKASIFKQYDALAKQAGEKGVMVDPSKIAIELQSVIDSKSLAIANPKAVEYAKSVQERLNSTGLIDAKTAQDVIGHYNDALKAFYKNPSYDTASTVAIDSLIANKFREQLDAGITGATGEQYQSLKNQYGALSSMEKDVTHRNIVWGRQNAVGLVGNIANITSGAELARGLITMNPADIVVSGVIKGAQKWMQYLNNPDIGVSRIFSEIDKSNPPSKGSTSELEGADKVEKPSPTSIAPPSPKVKGGTPDMQKDPLSIVNSFSKMKVGEEISNPTGLVKTDYKLSADIKNITGASGQNISFTRLSLKHLAEKGLEGERLIKQVPEILLKPDEIRQGSKSNRFLISKSIISTKGGRPQTVNLEVQKTGNDIIVTSFQSDKNYLSRFALLWKAAGLSK